MTDSSVLRYPYFTVAPQNAAFWATSYAIVPDPLSSTNDESLLDICLISDNFPRIPYSIFCRVANLFKSYANRASVINQQVAQSTTQNTFKSFSAAHNKVLEAAVGFFYNQELNDWICLVPEQTVTTGSVNYNFKKACNIVTGEELSIHDLEALDYMWMSRTHSHNTMHLDKPSTIDDGTELPFVQFCGLFSYMDFVANTYKITFTVVQPFDPLRKQNKRFFNIPRIQNLHWTRFVENPWDFSQCEDQWPDILPFDDEYMYHPNCDAYIKEQVRQLPTKTTYTYSYTPGKYLPPAKHTDESKSALINQYSLEYGDYPPGFTVKDYRDLVRNLLKYTNIQPTTLMDVLFEIEEELGLAPNGEVLDVVNADVDDPFYYMEY